MVLTEESWIEQYRPKSLNDLIFGNKQLLVNMLKKPFKMQHILLSSVTPGTGKTSTAKIIVNELKADYIIINSSKDRTLEVIRERINNFCANKSSNPNSPRIVIMDEVDGLGVQQQNAMRGVLEDFSSNAKFVFTCNNANKVTDAIQSRCVKIVFKTHSKPDIKKRLQHIIEREKVVISDDKLNQMIDKHYPSIRNMIQELQIYHLSDGKEHLVNHSEEIYNMIKNKKFLEIRKKVLEEGIDIEELVSDLWRLFIKDDIKNKKELVKEFAELDFRISEGATPDIQLLNFVVEVEKWF